LALVLCLLSVAGLYVTLSADFLAAAQILIYVGAISVLIILAIMMTRNIKDGNPSNKLRIPAFLVAIAFLAVMVYAVTATPWRISGAPPLFPTTTTLAAKLFARDGFILPVEIAAVLLLSAVIGAIVLAREKEK
ncbi:MAG: NADH-quinone oxidoreductase subunit J, partial [Dehalococcoidales bacterium]|nr:NADH-quinone oxidoreductase subunit J [Dehalococcoidales bacterium]